MYWKFLIFVFLFHLKKLVTVVDWSYPVYLVLTYHPLLSPNPPFIQVPSVLSFPPLTSTPLFHYQLLITFLSLVFLPSSTFLSLLSFPSSYNLLSLIALPPLNPLILSPSLNIASPPSTRPPFCHFPLLSPDLSPFCTLLPFSYFLFPYFPFLFLAITYSFLFQSLPSITLPPLNYCHFPHSYPP